MALGSFRPVALLTFAFDKGALHATVDKPAALVANQASTPIIEAR
jgi:hypothetical protein